MSNSTTITGNLTREPEIRYTKEGQATTQLGVAVNRRWQDRTTQEWQEATSFFDVVCWRDLAENVALSLTKGMRVVVTGRIEQRSWETDDGEHRSKVEIVADEIGPSLRFATADVQRTRRQGSRGGARVKRRRGSFVLSIQRLTARKATPGNGPGSAGVVARLHALSESAPWRSDMSPSKSHATRTSANPQNVISPHLQPRPSYPHPPP